MSRKAKEIEGYSYSAITPPHTILFLQFSPIPMWVLHGEWFWQDPPLGLHGLQLSLVCSGMGSFMGCKWISVSPWSSMGCRATASFTLVFSMVCAGILALKSGMSHPSFSPLTLECTGLFLSRFFHSLTVGFWKISSQRYWKYCLSSTMSCRRSPGSDFNQIEPSVPGMGQPLSSFLRCHPWTAAAANTCSHKANTKGENKDHSSATESAVEFFLFQRGQAYDSFPYSYYFVFRLNYMLPGEGMNSSAVIQLLW